MMDTPTGTGSTASAAPHITKENITTFNYYQLFQLAVPTAPPSAEAVTAATPEGTFNEHDISHIRKTFRRLSLRFHPDKDGSEGAKTAFAFLQKALETLLDPKQRSAYTAELLGVATGPESAAAAKRRKEAQQAEDDARWAESILKQKEQQQQDALAARRQAAEEQEQAQAKMQSELTAALHTPLKQLERELMDEWDVDADLLEVKRREVERLLRKLAAQQQKEEESLAKSQRTAAPLATGTEHTSGGRSEGVSQNTVARMMMQFLKHERTDSTAGATGQATKRPKF